MDTMVTEAVDLAENVEEAFDLAKLEDEFKAYAFECSCAMHLIEAKIRNIRDQFLMFPGRNPIAYIEVRIKTFESVVRKCERRNYGKTIADIREKCYDIAGIRVVTTFRDDIFVVRDRILHQPGIALVKEKDYVNNPKPNGYSALHLIVTNQITDADGLTKPITVEIQIRSRAEDLWATIEHSVNYKSLDPSPEAEDTFREMAKFLTKFDDAAIRFRDHVSPDNTKPGKKAKKSSKNPAK